MRSFSQPLPLRIYTHNIRYATASPFKNEKPWTVRKFGLCNSLLFHTQHIPQTFICLQEVLHLQIHDIHSRLQQEKSESWSYIGVGRDDGQTAGEYSPIFYDANIWELRNWKTVWLSPTPEKPSKGWDAGSIRIVTIGKFMHRETKAPVVIMSTHLDDQGSKSRLKSAKIILKEIGKLDEKDGAVFLAGDFNSQVGQEAYDAMTEAGTGIIDSRSKVEVDLRYGHELTFTGFSDADGVPTRIDFVFLKDGAATVKRYGVLENRFDDGMYVSDHRAVVVDAEITPAGLATEEVIQTYDTAESSCIRFDEEPNNLYKNEL